MPDYEMDVLTDSQIERLLADVRSRCAIPEVVLLAYVAESLLWRMSLQEENHEELVTQVQGLKCFRQGSCNGAAK